MIQHGDFLDKNIIATKDGNLVALDPLTINIFWFFDLARYVAWIRNINNQERIYYIKSLRKNIELPEEFEKTVAAFMAIEFMRNFIDSHKHYRESTIQFINTYAPKKY